MRSRQSVRFVTDHARRLLGGLDERLREELASDPVRAIPAWFDVTVRLRPEAVRADGCSVDGAYFPSPPPPRIVVAESLSRRRIWFSVLHEFGHHLQAEDETLDAVFCAEPDGGSLLEEDIADAFAAETLMPAELAAELIPETGPTAESVAALFETSAASREACCVHASHRIRGPGFVVLAELDGTVRFAAPANQPYRIAPGTRQGADHLLSLAAKRGNCRGQARLAYPSGTLTTPYHADAVAHDGYVFGVFVSRQPPWGGLSLLADDRPVGEPTVCPSCDHEFEGFGRPCTACRTRTCPRCERCSCTMPAAAKQRLCTECFLEKPIVQFRSGSDICDDCRD